jgi:hypothetical protein
MKYYHDDNCFGNGEALIWATDEQATKWAGEIWSEEITAADAIRMSREKGLPIFPLMYGICYVGNRAYGRAFRLADDGIHVPAVTAIDAQAEQALIDALNGRGGGFASWFLQKVV